MAFGSKYSNSDHYLDRATGVFKNRLGITTEAELENAEADLVLLRLAELSKTPVSGDFSLKHLQAIHKHLFQDVYIWAGELRTVDISKGNSYFATHSHIAGAAAVLFAELAREKHLAGLDKNGFGTRAAYYLAEINALHPFREGNGRTQREFISQLARKQGRVVDWQSVSTHAILEASICSFQGDIAPLETLIRANLYPLDRFNAEYSPLR